MKLKQDLYSGNAIGRFLSKFIVCQLLFRLRIFFEYLYIFKEFCLEFVVERYLEYRYQKQIDPRKKKRAQRQKRLSEESGLYRYRYVIHNNPIRIPYVHTLFFRFIVHVHDDQFFSESENRCLFFVVDFFHVFNFGCC